MIPLELKLGAAAVALLLAFGGGFALESRLAKGRMAAAQLAWQQQVQKAKDEAERQTAGMQGAVDGARGDLDATKTQIQQRDDAIGKLRVDVGVLRNALRTAQCPAPAGASGDAGAIGDIAAECVGLLSEGQQLYAACAAKHDTCAAEVRALIGAWPKTQP